jgi:hypothetical protein
MNKKPPAHRLVFLRYLGQAQWKKLGLAPSIVGRAWFADDTTK